MESYCLLLSLISVLFAKVQPFAVPSADFLLGIDGSSIATGHSHICVLEQKATDGMGGRAQCWGHERVEGATGTRNDMEFVQIVAAHDFTCGITLEQTVYCWGEKGIVSGFVPGLYEQISAASSGNIACGVLTDGKINCWGSELLSSKRPADPELRYVQVSCSRVHCCALDSNAYPHCWSAVGDLKETTPPTITYAQYVAAVNGPGVDASLLLQSSRGPRSDEEEDFDPAAGGNSASSSTAEEDQAVAKIQFRQISVGDGQSCGITLLGAHLHCWGGRNKRQPLHATGPFRQVSVGGSGVCAITAAPEEDDATDGDSGGDGGSGSAVPREADRLVCWGFADQMVHHSGDSAAGLLWDQVSVGATSVCAVTLDSEMKCWGGGIPPEYRDHPAKFIVA